MRLVIFTFLVLSSFIHAEVEPSYGWDVPNSSLNIGGYLDMTYDDKRDDAFLFNDIAVILSGNQDRFDLLGEIELSHISLDGKSNGNTDVDINVERLQLTYALSDTQNIRVGRFNSDIGYWNQAPITILQDTTTKPHIVTNLFPKATTGVLYKKYINENNSFSLTFQHNKDIAHQDESIEVDRHKAFAYHGEKDDFSWRLSLGAYRDSNHIEAKYLGIGSMYDGEDFLVQAELFTQDSDKTNKKPFSGYIQPTWHVNDKQDAVFRFESYDDNALDVNEDVYLFGYVYRPSRNMALKAEYIHHTELPLNRVVYSLSVLF
jgi:hypothetical protein